MDLKNILKQIKSYESSISTVLGFIVIVVIGLLVVNYFRNLDNTGQIDEIAEATTNETTDTTHTIAKGESLWTIAEDYYGDGFRWTEIMDANNLQSPGDIKEGQEIIIPNVSDTMVAEATEEPIAMVEATPEPTIEPAATLEPVEEVVATPEPIVANQDEVTPAVSENGTYTVVHGDNLWNIAVAVYGNGYRWVDIAQANHLANPQIIHAGNVFVIPN